MQRKRNRCNAGNGKATAFRRILASLLLAIAPGYSASQSTRPPQACPDLDNALQPRTTLPITACNHPMPQGTYIRAHQVPPAPAAGQFVTGTLDFSTDGQTNYDLSPTSTRTEEEHSLWCLTYSRDPGSGARTLNSDTKQWFHQTEDIVFNSSGTGPYWQVVTLDTLSWAGNVPPVGQSTLTIANMTGADKLTYRGLSMSSGESLPAIVVQEVKKQYSFPQNHSAACQVVTLMNGTQPHPMTAFLEISQEWMWGQWTTPYAGQISTMNNYRAYLVPPPPSAKPGTTGTPWLKVDAVWVTQPQ
jgi:hypothetical protein